ncbi:MAG: glycoside hydrolase, partial [Gammaproteobacteria bacterium]|nr:glycoside hydrolase [Gammaproteobacteria bacterium]
QDGDLVAATMGRGFWILDDITPLREATAKTAAKPAHLFKPAVAIRLRASTNRDTPPPPSEPRGANPPAGAIFDYWLKDDAKEPVTLTVRDAQGKIVRRFSSAATPRNLKANRYFEESWVGDATPRLSAAAGAHRFVWNLRWPRPPAITYHYSISAVWPGDTPLVPQGGLAVPGHYTVTLEVDGRQYTQPLTIRLDPRVQISTRALAANHALEYRISAMLERAIDAYDASGERLAKLRNQGEEERIKLLEAWRDQGPYSLRAVAGALDTLATKLEMSDAAPTEGQQAVFAVYGKKLDALLARWTQRQ